MSEIGYHLSVCVIFLCNFVAFVYFLLKWTFRLFNTGALVNVYMLFVQQIREQRWLFHACKNYKTRLGEFCNIISEIITQFPYDFQKIFICFRLNKHKNAFWIFDICVTLINSKSKQKLIPTKDSLIFLCYYVTVTIRYKQISCHPHTRT